MTLNDLVTGTSEQPPLIAQLVDGWRRLRRQHPDHRIVVHLVTNAYPSSSASASLPSTSTPPTPYHFAAFIEQSWCQHKETVRSILMEPGGQCGMLCKLPRRVNG